MTFKPQIPRMGEPQIPRRGGAPDSSKGGAQVEVVEVPQNGVQRGDVQVQDCRAGGAWDDEFVKQLESCPLPEVPLQVLEKNPPEVDVNAEDVAKQEFQNKMAELQDVKCQTHHLCGSRE